MSDIFLEAAFQLTNLFIRFEIKLAIFASLESSSES